MAIMEAPKGGRLGIIGGSGLYDIPGLSDTRWVTIESPFGLPSGQFLFGKLAGRDGARGRGGWSATS